MKLILTAPVNHLGGAGDVVDVRPGYGRNYLVPQGYALQWTKGGEKQIAGIRRARDAREIRGVEHAQEVRAQLAELGVQIGVRAAEGGRLFGAVTPAMITTAIRRAGGPSIDKRAVQTAGPIKSLGTHTVGVKLHDAVTAHIDVDVVAQD
jgi:large subunit ribosomal protein L9